MERIIWALMGVVAVAAIIFWTVLGVSFTKGCQMVKDEGLKAVVERVWEGEKTDEQEQQQ